MKQRSMDWFKKILTVRELVVVSYMFTTVIYRGKLICFSKNKKLLNQRLSM